LQSECRPSGVPLVPKIMRAHPDLDTPLPLSREPATIHPPLVVNETLVYPFKYWNEGIQRGIRYSNEIYAYMQSYPVSERLKAYEMAYEQAEQGATVCITVSKTHYSVWLNLRSPAHLLTRT